MNVRIPRRGARNEGVNPSSGKLQPALSVLPFTALRRSGSVMACRAPASCERAIRLLPSSSSTRVHFMPGHAKLEGVGRTKLRRSKLQAPRRISILAICFFDDAIIRRQAREPRGETRDDAGPRPSVIDLVGSPPPPQAGSNEGDDRSARTLQPSLSVYPNTAPRRSGSAIACRATASYEKAICALPASSSMWM